MTTQLAFRETRFDIIDRNGQPWLRAAQIAEALGYSRSDKITQLYERNADEFTPGMTETLKLTVSGNMQTDTRIFSLRGAHLLAMLARTPTARDFRRWVLDILDRETGAPAPTHKPAHGRPADHQPMTLEQRQAIINAAHVRVCEFPAKRRVDAQDCLRAALNAEFGASVCADARQFTDVVQFIKSFEFNLQPVRRGRPRKAPAAPAATTTARTTPDTRPSPLAILAMDTAALAIEGIDELLSCCASVPPRMMATARMYRELLQLNWNDAHAARLAMVPA